MNPGILSVLERTGPWEEELGFSPGATTVRTVWPRSPHFSLSSYFLTPKKCCGIGLEHFIGEASHGEIISGLAGTASMTRLLKSSVHLTFRIGSQDGVQALGSWELCGLPDMDTASPDQCCCCLHLKCSGLHQVSWRALSSPATPTPRPVSFRKKNMNNHAHFAWLPKR